MNEELSDLEQTDEIVCYSNEQYPALFGAARRYTLEYCSTRLILLFTSVYCRESGSDKSYTYVTVLYSITVVIWLQ